MSIAPGWPAGIATPAAPSPAFAGALGALPSGTRVDPGIACEDDALIFPPRAAWLWLPLPAETGCHSLELVATGALAFRAEIVTSAGSVAVPLAGEAGHFTLDVEFEAPVAWLRLLPVEAATVRFSHYRITGREPWQSMLPDWRIGPVRLPVRQGSLKRAHLSGMTPAGWDRDIAVEAAENARCDATTVESGAFGALLLTFADPLAAGHHLVEAEFRDADGGPALVAPRFYADEAAVNAKPIAHFRRRRGARYVARLHLMQPTSRLVFVPRQERGSVAIEGLRVRRLGPAAVSLSLLAEGWRHAGPRLLVPFERLAGMDPDADGPAGRLLRLATRGDFAYRASLRREGETLRRVLARPVSHAGELAVAIGPGTEFARAITRASIEACGDPAWREAGDDETADISLVAGTRLAPHALAVVRRTAAQALNTDRLTLGLRSAPQFVAEASTPLVMAHRPAQATASADAPVSPGPAGAITVITATKDAPAHLARFLASWRATRPPATGLVLVDNGTADARALGLLADAAADPFVTVVVDDRPFNFAALNNLGAAQADGDILIFANNDIEFRYGGWAEALAAALRTGRTGVAGARLDYPAGRVQHAGVVLAGEARVRHLERFAPGSGVGHFGRWRRLTEVSAVTGALMAVRRGDFLALGGFDAARYPVLYNDVDFCLRARVAGHGVVLAAGARAVHHESVTLASRDRGAVWRLERSVEADRFRQDWAPRIDHDPCYPAGCDPVEAAFRAFR